MNVHDMWHTAVGGSGSSLWLLFTEKETLVPRSCIHGYTAGKGKILALYPGGETPEATLLGITGIFFKPTLMQL